MSLAKTLAKTIYEAAGWKLAGSLPPHIRKCVMTAAPHTSNWDFIYARAAFYLLGLPVRFTIKAEYMRFPFKTLMQNMGALPVDRGKRNNLVQTMVDILNKDKEIVILVTPEGTRNYQPRWRKGFYYAALNAGVPIVLGYMDYAKKKRHRAGVHAHRRCGRRYRKDQGFLPQCHSEIPGERRSVRW